MEFPLSIVTATEYQQNLVLRCVATGKPGPTVLWYNGSTEFTAYDNVTYSSSVTTYNSTTTVHEFTIREVSVNDFGNWTCKASNTIANGVQATDEDTMLLAISCTFVSFVCIFYCYVLKQFVKKYLQLQYFWFPSQK